MLILNVRIISSAESLSSCSEHIFGGADHAAPHSLGECHSDVSSGQRLAARPLSLWLIQLTEGVRYQQKTPAVCDVIISWVIDIIQPNISKKSLCLKQSKQLIIPSLQYGKSHCFTLFRIRTFSVRKDHNTRREIIVSFEPDIIKDRSEVRASAANRNNIHQIAHAIKRYRLCNINIEKAKFPSEVSAELFNDAFQFRIYLA